MFVRVAAHDRERGAVAIIVAVFAIVAMILLAFVIDRGRIYVVRAQLQNTVDAAALAAVQNTCANPIASAGAVRDVAVQYGALNGVTIDPANVIVQDGVSDVTTGVSVAAESTLPPIFGVFAGAGDSTVAARGTATRSCRMTFQYVADQDFNFNGTGATIDGNIFAGKCFDGDNGTFNGNVAVSTAESEAAQEANCSSFLPGAATYAIWNDNQNDNGTSCPDKVDSCDYGATGVTLSGAVTSAGYDLGTINGLVLTTSCGSVTKAMLESGPVYCTGTLTIPNNTTIQHDIVVDGDINDRNDTLFLGTNNGSATAPFVANRVLVYSRTGAIDLQASAVIPSAFIFFAPTNLGTQPSIKYHGGSQNLDASFVGSVIEADGAGGSGSAGLNVRFAGPYRLSQ